MKLKCPYGPAHNCTEEFTMEMILGLIEKAGYRPEDILSQVQTLLPLWRLKKVITR